MEKLKNKKLIDKLFIKGAKSISIDGLRMVYYKSDISGVMVTASKSNFKRAVDRNLIKRHLRNSLIGKEVDGYVIAFLYTRNDIKDHVWFLDTVTKLVKKLND